MEKIISIMPATLADAPAILALQKWAYQSEARLYNDWSIPPLTQTLAELEAEFDTHSILKATHANRLVGSVRFRVRNGDCAIGRLMVDPEHQRKGWGAALLEAVESVAPPSVETFSLFTGSQSQENIRLYQRHGYQVTQQEALSPAVTLVFLEKQRA